ncbi:MAG: DUF262 domain-containing protein [Cloacibacterium sp.]|nr:DUF262 domain-containing protein [Cloacibacterium sp.]
MSQVSTKIEAKDYSISDVLSNKKYTIDYFQREYKWQQFHIEQLIADLETSFFLNYDPSHERQEVSNYNSYYLGPIVLSNKDGKRSVIDGQQRLTSLTIFLIYLNNLQKDLPKRINLDALIYSETYGEKSFNLDVPERKNCLDALYLTGEYNVKDSDDETVKNIAERYDDIQELFPDELKGAALPFFIDWLIQNVVLVVITAYSDDNAYTIFETMNDRGLNLTPSEMLKGYLLSKVRTTDQRDKINIVWKAEIKKLHNLWEESDLTFFQAWLRGKYAVSIRPGKIGAANEDFEKIGTRFHTWVKDNNSKIGISNPNDFYEFVNTDLVFYSKLFSKIYEARRTLTTGLNHLYFSAQWGFANSLADPLLISSILISDDETTINKKLNLVARFIETFAVYRGANYRNFSQSSIRYTMYNLVLELRDKSINEVGEILKRKLTDVEENLAGISRLGMHGQNKHFIKFLLSRITAHIEQQSGRTTDFSTYFNNTGGKPFEIEHIWADKMSFHADEFSQVHEFNEIRNRLGDLILLPRGTNQSFGALRYEKKLPHYLKENLLAQSLHEACYERNPNFLNYFQNSNLDFKSHEEYKKEDVFARQELYRQICEEIWTLDFFSEN